MNNTTAKESSGSRDNITFPRGDLKKYIRQARSDNVLLYIMPLIKKMASAMRRGTKNILPGLFRTKVIILTLLTHKSPFVRMVDLNKTYIWQGPRFLIDRGNLYKLCILHR